MAALGTDALQVEQVRIPSGGVSIAGDLYTPSGPHPEGGRPALVVGHGFSFVKEALVEQASFFARAGYAALAIDYRSFGESEGEPRGQLFPLNQVEDYRNAISYLEERPEVDAGAIGIWGTSFGGAVVIYTAAFDRRVKAVVAQVPVVNGREWMRALRTADQWEELLDRLREDRRRRFRGEPSERVAVTGRGSKGDFAVMPSDAAIVEFLAAAKAQLRTWREDIALESAEKVIEFNPEAVIHLVGPRALCVVTAAGYDVIHPVDHILQAYAKATEPKKLVLLPFHQLEMYTQPAMNVGLQHALDWFQQHVPAVPAMAATEPALSASR